MKTSKLVIITPSYMNSDSRIAFAQRSFESLRLCLGEETPVIVVDDIPRIHARFPWRLIPDMKYFRAAAGVYVGKKNVTLLRRYGRGSTQAYLKGLKYARQQGYRYVFMHMDDNCYLPVAGPLVQQAVRAMDDDESLGVVRMTCYPMVGSFCNPELGNKTLLTIRDESVSFEQIKLTPRRYEDFTLWSSPYQPESNDGTFHPLTLWSVIYRIDFLEKLLSHPDLRQCLHLTHAESYYRKPEHYREFMSWYQGKFGFINMQYVGYETHQNEGRWQEIVNRPNTPVL